MYDSSDVTMPAIRRQVEANQRRRQQQQQRPQQRQLHDDYDYNYYNDYSYYDTHAPPRPSAITGFHDVSDNNDDDSGLFVQRIIVGPY